MKAVIGVVCALAVVVGTWLTLAVGRSVKFQGDSEVVFGQVVGQLISAFDRLQPCEPPFDHPVVRNTQYRCVYMTLLKDGDLYKSQNVRAVISAQARNLGLRQRGWQRPAGGASFVNVLEYRVAGKGLQTLEVLYGNITTLNGQPAESLTFYQTK